MRNDTFDVLKGIGIIAVIVGHSAIPEIVRNFIFTWHMPLFFMTSGYFYKQVPSSIALRKNFRSLVIPYLFTALILFLFTLIDSFLGQKNIVDNNIKNSILAIVVAAGSRDLPNGGEFYVGAIWFLTALFWCRMSFNLICKKFCTNFLAVSIVISIISTLIAQYIYIPLNILQGLSALLFFSFGYFVKTNELLNKTINKYYILIILILIILSTYMGPIGMVTCYYPCYVINILASIGGGYLLYIISSEIYGTRYGQILSNIGKLSLIILCFHIIDTQFLSKICYYIGRVARIGDTSFKILLFTWHLLIPIVGAKLITYSRICRVVFNQH